MCEDPRVEESTLTVADTPAVRQVLAQVGGDARREIVVVNKADAADPHVLDTLRRQERDVLVVSARTGQGLAQLGAVIDAQLPRPDIRMTVHLPYDRGDLVNLLH